MPQLADAECHVWTADGVYDGTRRLTVADRRTLTALGWKMRLTSWGTPVPTSTGSARPPR